MRVRWLLFSVLLGVALNLPSSSLRAQEPSTSPSGGIAVVELFTSQGCSSCPPADVALRQIAKTANDEDANVYVLSFHVDYWNRLGWNDPYSSQLASYRQRAYARAAGSKRVYTPQMIVSGTTEFVGSNRAKANKAIGEALSRSAKSTVSMKVSAADGGVDIDYEVNGAGKDQLLNLAVVHTPKANDVPAGENQGRKLAHVNVVRAFKAVRLSEFSGSARLELPEGLLASDAQVIGYVQDLNSLAITGASTIQVQ
ncbi:MAG: DUF1223 domain-containing protein [Planctomycetota bacterium]